MFAVSPRRQALTPLWSRVCCLLSYKSCTLLAYLELIFTLNKAGTKKKASLTQQSQPSWTSTCCTEASGNLCLTIILLVVLSGFFGGCFSQFNCVNEVRICFPGLDCPQSNACNLPQQPASPALRVSGRTGSNRGAAASLLGPESCAFVEENDLPFCFHSALADVNRWKPNHDMVQCRPSVLGGRWGAPASSSTCPSWLLPVLREPPVPPCPIPRQVFSRIFPRGAYLIGCSRACCVLRAWVVF